MRKEADEVQADINAKKALLSEKCFLSFYLVDEV
jgi:hypothetical protein